MNKYPRQIWLIESEYHDIQWSEEPNPFAVIPEDEGLRYFRVDVVEGMMAEQRKMCGFKAVDFFKKHGNSIYFDDLPDKLFDACLNATGETKDVR